MQVDRLKAEGIQAEGVQGVRGEVARSCITFSLNPLPPEPLDHHTH
jgi:hypothetical protein